MPLYYGYGYGYGAMFDPLYLVVVIVSLVLGLAAQAYINLPHLVQGFLRWMFR